MIRDVVVEGFVEGGSEDGGGVGVVAGGRVVEGVVLGAVGDGFVVAVVGADEMVDLLVGADGWELPDVAALADEPDPVVTTDGLTVSGTRPVLVGSAAGSVEHADSVRAAATSTVAARLLNCVMNLPDPPTEQPPGLLLPDVGGYPQSADPAPVVHTITQQACGVRREVRPIV